MEVFKTSKMLDREIKDARLYAEYQELIKVGGSKVEIKKYLMQKYGYFTLSSVYIALKRAEKNLQKA